MLGEKKMNSQVFILKGKTLLDVHNRLKKVLSEPLNILIPQKRRNKLFQEVKRIKSTPPLSFIPTLLSSNGITLTITIWYELLDLNLIDIKDKFFDELQRNIPLSELYNAACIERHIYRILETAVIEALKPIESLCIKWSKLIKKCKSVQPCIIVTVNNLPFIDTWANFPLEAEPLLQEFTQELIRVEKQLQP